MTGNSAKKETNNITNGINVFIFSHTEYLSLEYPSISLELSFPISGISKRVRTIFSIIPTTVNKTICIIIEPPTLANVFNAEPICWDVDDIGVNIPLMLKLEITF